MKSIKEKDIDTEFVKLVYGENTIYQRAGNSYIRRENMLIPIYVVFMENGENIEPSPIVIISKNDIIRDIINDL